MSIDLLRDRVLRHLPRELRERYADLPLEEAVHALLRELEVGRGRRQFSPAPPVQCVALATLPRGANRELRVQLCECAGRLFIELRVWRRDPRGPWVHSKGTTVQPAELPAVREALERAGALLCINDTTQPGTPGNA